MKGSRGSRVKGSGVVGDQGVWGGRGSGIKGGLG